MEEKQFDEIEIDLLQLLGVLWEKILWILGATVSAALIVLLITIFLITPMYQSTASLYVINRQGAEGSATSSDLSAATSLTYDFEQMVTTNLVLEPTIQKLKLDMTSAQLAKRVTVNNPTNTRILEITVTDEDPKRAKRIADTLSDISANAIVEVMEIEKVNSIDRGLVAQSPASPSIKKNVLIGALLGAFFSCAVIVLRFLLDDTIKNEEDVEKYLSVSVLGSIPDMENNKPHRKRIGRKSSQKKGKR